MKGCAIKIKEKTNGWHLKKRTTNNKVPEKEELTTRKKGEEKEKPMTKEKQRHKNNIQQQNIGKNCMIRKADMQQIDSKKNIVK